MLLSKLFFLILTFPPWSPIVCTSSPSTLRPQIPYFFIISLLLLSLQPSPQMSSLMPSCHGEYHSVFQNPTSFTQPPFSMPDQSHFFQTNTMPLTSLYLWFSDFKPALTSLEDQIKCLQARIMDSGFCNTHSVSDGYTIDEKFLITEALF